MENTRYWNSPLKSKNVTHLFQFFLFRRKANYLLREKEELDGFMKNNLESGFLLYFFDGWLQLLPMDILIKKGLITKLLQKRNVNKHPPGAKAVIPSLYMETTLSYSPSSPLDA